jgi:hypothetical protein
LPGRCAWLSEVITENTLLEWGDGTGGRGHEVRGQRWRRPVYVYNSYLVELYAPNFVHTV